ncbi:hypothetical protein [Paenibacillus sp. O199]|uniref:hypothetical protein n=1 Tax=Paenibacillus sp. O199 TaxID=1643925 RepID=UPI0007BF97B9|nr:hypothetical protein [Paenibacillus sp. O199]
MKTTSPAEVGKALKDLATRIREQEENIEMEDILAYLHSQGKTDITLEKLKEDYEKALHFAKNAINVNTEETWLKLGYTFEQSKKLEKLNGNELTNAIKGYEKEIESKNE